MTDANTSSPSQIRVAALYRFAVIDDVAGVRDRLQAVCEAGEAKGTLLVATEGLNGTIAGPEAGIETILSEIRTITGFEALEVKYAWTDAPPFLRLKVKIKPEIVTMGQPDLDPAREAGLYVSPEDWNALIADPTTLVIDTRNDYEGEIGAFERAVQPNTRSFRDFPDWFHSEGRALLDEMKPRRVAMYCTGGIRCEKSTAFLKQEGVDNVHHLEGGILRYLETMDEERSLWRGECFVFDERVSVGHGLSQGTHSLCRGCRAPVSETGRASPHFIEGVCCDNCRDTRDDQQRLRYAERQRQMALAEAGYAHRADGDAAHGAAAGDWRRHRRGRAERSYRDLPTGAPVLMIGR